MNVSWINSSVNYFSWKDLVKLIFVTENVNGNGAAKRTTEQSNRAGENSFPGLVACHLNKQINILYCMIQNRRDENMEN